MGHAATDWVASRENRGTARGADFGRDVELGEAGAFGGHLVEVRGANDRMSVATQVTVTQVIGEDDDDIGLGRGRDREGKRAEDGQ